MGILSYLKVTQIFDEPPTRTSHPRHNGLSASRETRTRKYSPKQKPLSSTSTFSTIPSELPIRFLVSIVWLIMGRLCIWTQKATLSKLSWFTDLSASTLCKSSRYLSNDHGPSNMIFSRISRPG
ncbi:hypothetical protein ACB098_04G151700 [Castanea mollissima]